MAAPDNLNDQLIDISDIASELFHGPSAHLAERFSIEEGSTEGICCSTLKDPATLKGLLDQYASARFDRDDFRSVASYWSQWYFGLSLPPLMILSETSGCEIPSALESLRLILDDDGQPQRFVLTQTLHPVRKSSGNAFEQIEQLFNQHLAPLVFSFSARSGVSAKVFWMNIAILIDYIQDTFLSPENFQLKDLTSERTNPAGSRNPLFGPYRPASSEATRMRRVCCLRYALPDVPRCPDCALQPAQVGKRKRTVLGAENSDAKTGSEES